MKIEWTNKKDGTRVKNKNFPYLQDGKAVGASYEAATGLKPAFYVSEAGDGVRELKQ